MTQLQHDITVGSANVLTCLNLLNMPTDSSFPPVDIPNVDLWGLMFDRKSKDFQDDQGTFNQSIDLHSHFSPPQSPLPTCSHHLPTRYQDIHPHIIP